MSFSFAVVAHESDDWCRIGSMESREDQLPAADDWPDVATRLTELANRLLEWPSEPLRLWRRQSLRYGHGPFLRVLSDRPDFCRALSNVLGDLDSLSDQDQADVLLGFVDRFKLPTKGGFERKEWLLILLSVRSSTYGAKARHPYDPAMHDLASGLFYEVQFVYPTTSFGRIVGPLLVEAFHIARPYNKTRKEAEKTISRDIRAGLDRFVPLARRRRTSGPRFRPDFFVRLIASLPDFEQRETPEGEMLVLTHGTPLLAESSLVTSFVVEWTDGQRISSLHAQIVATLVDAISSHVRPAPHSGRPLETERLVEWWQATVFDGLSPRQIAIRSVGNTDAALNLEENIRRRLYEIGVEPVRK